MVYTLLLFPAILSYFLAQALPCISVRQEYTLELDLLLVSGFTLSIWINIILNNLIGILNINP